MDKKQPTALGEAGRKRQIGFNSVWISFSEQLLKYLADIEDGTPEEDVLYLIHTFEEVYQSCREDPKCSLREVCGYFTRVPLEAGRSI